MHKYQVFMGKKIWKTFITGTIDLKTNIYRDKRLQKHFYRDLNQKRLRTTALGGLQSTPELFCLYNSFTLMLLEAKVIIMRAILGF